MAHYAMLVDVRRCAGCYACVVACQLWNDQRSGNEAWSHVERREWEDGAGQPHRGYVPHACMHCAEAPCQQICPTGATYTREDGIVMVDYEKCIACGACITACPYEARVLAQSQANWFDAAEPAPYEEGARAQTAVEKCIFCAPRVDEGLKPACVVNCPGKARVFGDLDDPESDVSKALAAAGDAAYNVPGTSFYYIGFEEMPAELLPQPFEPMAFSPVPTASN